MATGDEQVQTNNQISSGPDSFSRAATYVFKCLPLQRAAMKGDWKLAESIIANEPWMLSTQITENGDTALHLAAASRKVSFTQNLVDRMTEEETATLNGRKVTALCFTASTGIKKIAEKMVDKNKDLPEICGDGAVKPLYMAALQGHGTMAEFLYSKSCFPEWHIKDQVILLNLCIRSNLCGLALKIFHDCKELALGEDGDGEKPLKVLARKPSAFEGASQQPLWRRIVHSVFPYVKKPRQETDGHKLFRHLWNYFLHQGATSTAEIITYGSQLLFIAAQLGNVEFLVELLSSCPELIFKVDERMRTIFHISVGNRDEKTFNLIYEVGFKDLIASHKEDSGENMLHIAAQLPPRNRLAVVSGAALQLQRELLWFKAVEKIVPPAYKDMQNSTEQTPHDLFVKEHEDLTKEGEKWMRDTANSCMLVATLVATVVFTLSCTVPGGYDNSTGAPILLHNKFFTMFFLSEAVAMFSSTISITMFLSILISRYAEEDFLTALPLKLLMGITALLVAIAAMMFAFCTSFLTPWHYGLVWVLTLFATFAVVPVLLISLVSPLLVAVLHSACCSRFMFQPNDRLFDASYHVD